MCIPVCQASNASGCCWFLTSSNIDGTTGRDLDQPLPPPSQTIMLLGFDLLCRSHTGVTASCHPYIPECHSDLGFGEPALLARAPSQHSIASCDGSTHRVCRHLDRGRPSTAARCGLACTQVGSSSTMEGSGIGCPTPIQGAVSCALLKQMNFVATCEVQVDSLPCEVPQSNPRLQCHAPPNADASHRHCHSMHRAIRRRCVQQGSASRQHLQYQQCVTHRTIHPCVSTSTSDHDALRIA